MSTTARKRVNAAMRERGSPGDRPRRIRIGSPLDRLIESLGPDEKPALPPRIPAALQTLFLRAAPRLKGCNAVPAR